MTDHLSRRDLVKNLAIAAGVLATAKVGSSRAAAAPVHLDEKDPMAVALGYVSDAKKVDPKKVPNYKAGSACSNCLQLQGKAPDPFRPCNLFPGKLVDSNGWCKAYVKKP
jgi:High potential iron-sulfur protein